MALGGTMYNTCCSLGSGEIYKSQQSPSDIENSSDTQATLIFNFIFLISKHLSNQTLKMASQHSTFTTSRSFTYSYIHIRPTTDSQSQTSKPYLLFLHGFPSSSYDWRHQIPYFQQKGYGIIAPDLLGYGGSSKPLDVKAYMGKDMAKDVYELLKSEGIEENVFGVAHDWYVFSFEHFLPGHDSHIQTHTSKAYEKLS